MKVVNCITPPKWYKTPNVQIEALRALLQNAGVYDELRTEFEQCAARIPAFNIASPTQTLILAFYLPDKNGKTGLQRTMQVLWDSVTGAKNLKISLDMLHLAPDYNWTPVVRWILFDHNASYSISGKNALKIAAECGKQCVTVEPLIIAATNRDYVNAWSIFGNGSTPYPYMSGIQFGYKADDARNVYTPYLIRDGRELKLGAIESDYRCLTSTTPTLRALTG